MTAWISAALIDELNDAMVRGTVGQRAEIFHRITDLFTRAARDYSDDQIGLFDDVLMRIAATIELSARASLAKRLAQEPRAPQRISRFLASDDAIDVAGPVLEQSQRLDHDTLLETALTKGQRHLLAIARRSSLDEALTDVLVERGDKAVVLSAAGNPGARFSDRGYTHAHQAVGTRRRTRRLRRAAARHSTPSPGAASRQGLGRGAPEARGGQSVDGAAHQGGGLAGRQHGARPGRRSAAQLRRGGPTDRRAAGGRSTQRKNAAAFAAANQFELTVVALACLCGLPIETVDRAMSDERPDAILIIAKAVGLAAGRRHSHFAHARGRARHFTGRTRTVPRHVCAPEAAARPADREIPRQPRARRPV